MDKKTQEMLYMLLGNNVRRYRTQAGLTQDQLAAEIDLTRTSVAKIEKGKQHTPLHLLLTIAEILGTTLNALVPSETEYQLTAQIDEKTLRDVKEEDKNKFDVFYEDFIKSQQL